MFPPRFVVIPPVAVAPARSPMWHQRQSSSFQTVFRHGDRRSLATISGTAKPLRSRSRTPRRGISPQSLSRGDLTVHVRDIASWRLEPLSLPQRCQQHSCKCHVASGYWFVRRQGHGSSCIERWVRSTDSFPSGGPLRHSRDCRQEPSVDGARKQSLTTLPTFLKHSPTTMSNDHAVPPIPSVAVHRNRSSQEHAQPRRRPPIGRTESGVPGPTNGTVRGHANTRGTASATLVERCWLM